MLFRSHAVAKSLGCEVSGWTAEEDQGWRFDLGRLQELWRDNTRLVVVNFPHNPTGYLPSQEEWRSLIELAGERDVYPLSDEMYRLLEFDQHDRLPSACELYEKAASLSGLSKSFGLPGLRIGWMAGRDRGLLDQMSRLKDYTTICNSAPSEILGLMALHRRDDIIAGRLEIIRANLAVLDDFFSEYRDIFSWNRPRAGSVCFPGMPETKDSHDFCETMVREAGLMLVPSTMFDYGRRHVRIGFGRKNLPETIGRFADYLDARFRR